MLKVNLPVTVWLHIIFDSFSNKNVQLLEATCQFQAQISQKQNLNPIDFLTQV